VADAGIAAPHLSLSGSGSGGSSSTSSRSRTGLGTADGGVPVYLVARLPTGFIAGVQAAHLQRRHLAQKLAVPHTERGRHGSVFRRLEGAAPSRRRWTLLGPLARLPPRSRRGCRRTN
jgi:hypothetical protein